MRSPPRWAGGDVLLRCARSLPILLVLTATACESKPERSAPIADLRIRSLNDPAYRAALAELADRRPSRAEQLLAPALGDSARRTAWVVLLDAEIAGAGGRWARVDSLASDALVESSPARAPARLLRARGALERGDIAAALGHARAARS
ncbi:MAG: hypothetical protein M3068_03785, partial [Gemmatimonadota bacterium]|nr:hypothetical protein [Gemmatimonadota bacterium]